MADVNEARGRARRRPGINRLIGRTLKEFPQEFSRIEPLKLIERVLVVGRSVTVTTFGAFRFPVIARLKEWFRSSTDVLFGDTARQCSRWGGLSFKE